MNKIITFILLSFCAKILSASDLENIFDNMVKYKARFDMDRQISSKAFRCIDFKSMLDLTHSCDTIFVDEEYYDDGNYFIAMWNIQKPDIKTTFANGMVNPKYSYYYSKKQDYLTLVNDWNIEMLRILGQDRNIPELGIGRCGVGFHILTRIIMNGETYSWESVDFYEPVLNKAYRDDLIRIYNEKYKNSRLPNDKNYISPDADGHNSAI